MNMDGIKIGEAANLLGTSVRTLRYYEEQGLVSPLRTTGGTRLYAPVHIERLKAVLHLARCGLPIERIAAICQARDSCATGDESSKKVGRGLDEVLDILDRQIQTLSDLKEEIRIGRTVVERCRGCKNRPTAAGCPRCPVGRQRADINVLNLIWDQTQPEPS